MFEGRSDDSFGSSELAIAAPATLIEVEGTA